MTTSVAEPTLSAFMKWDGKPIESPSERSSIFCALVQMVKYGQAFGRSLVDKAVSFLEHIKIKSESDVDSFLFDLVPSSHQESSRTFVESVVELISVPNQKIVIAALDLVQHIFHHSSLYTQHILVNNGLITRIISSLDILSLSFTDSEAIHFSLLIILLVTVSYSANAALVTLDTVYTDIHQTFCGILHNCVVLPSEGYIHHLCKNRYLIKDNYQSYLFVNLLLQLLGASLCHPTTMELVLNMPICLAIPSSITFFDRDIPFLEVTIPRRSPSDDDSTLFLVRHVNSSRFVMDVISIPSTTRLAMHGTCNPPQHHLSHNLPGTRKIHPSKSDLSNRNSSPTNHNPPARDENNSQQDIAPQFSLD
ncbi:hypothetical protein BLNAU_14240 [Blattamonas nauphoetae]|uniref:Uncharacterized protein n=1 Tax=Blattamonas nauphoetae TaxID=2049346 RepID=A0ABQ9XHL0_9EUKA|nr:hypothetical protein BLNAU_14240 [Blattamonas nauphoetae]